MKLRNKKNGQVVDWSFVGPTAIKEYGDEDVLLERERYESIEEFISEWEDYKPAEPLIKDEKLRKAIRAFAELHDSKTITFEETFGGASYISRADNGYSMMWVLGKSWGGENIECDKPYTIAELCGEEEE